MRQEFRSLVFSGRDFEGIISILSVKFSSEGEEVDERLEVIDVEFQWFRHSSILFIVVEGTETDLQVVARNYQGQQASEQ